MLSAASAASDNVRREIDLAQDAGRSIYILNLDQAKTTPDGLLITFNPGLVAPYMGGLMPTVLVPYTELQTVMDPQGPLGKMLP